MERAISGGDPQVGPATAAGGFAGLPGGFPGSAGSDGRPGGLSGGDSDGAPALPPGDRPGVLPGGGDGFPGASPGLLPGGGGSLPGGGGTLPGGGADGGPASGAGNEAGTLSSETIDYLVANRGGATWLVVVPSANVAGPIQLQTGVPVMAMGGFSGSDPTPTLEQLQGYLRSGELRFVLASGRFGSLPGPGGARGSGASSSEIASWVAEACTPVRIGGANGDGANGSDDAGSAAAAALYDCAGATD
jgi:hypothetical protein